MYPLKGAGEPSYLKLAINGPRPGSCPAVRINLCVAHTMHAPGTAMPTTAVQAVAADALLMPQRTAMPTELPTAERDSDY